MHPAPCTLHAARCITPPPLSPLPPPLPLPPAPCPLAGVRRRTHMLICVRVRGPNGREREVKKKWVVVSMIEDILLDTVRVRVGVRVEG